MNNASSTITLSILGFLMTVIWGEPFILFLKRFRLGKVVRAEGPQEQFDKGGTPTMGGVMFIVPTLLVTIMLNAASLFGVDIIGQTFVTPMVALVIFGILGGIDDWIGMDKQREGKGFRARDKFILQVVFALAIAWAIKYGLGISCFYWPGNPEPIELGYFFIPLAAFIIVGESNAINLTDGMDGLAGMISATAFAGYGIIALMVGQPHIGGFCFIIVGAILAFLWYNVHPAQLFMGDCGSLSLGATLAVIALITGHLLVLPLITIIPMAETLSDIIQIVYFRFSGGNRFFLMAPLHHHFNKLGWSEVQIVQRFWLISILAVLFGVAISMV